MNHQLDLHFPSAPTPLQPDPEIERLLSYLEQNPGFHTARQLSASLGLTDRQIRTIAEQNRNLIVSGPGSPGYCHLNHCPTEKIRHYTEQMISQGKKMIRAGITTRRSAHARLG